MPSKLFRIVDVIKEDRELKLAHLLVCWEDNAGKEDGDEED